jgi:hypothetical protein
MPSLLEGITYDMVLVHLVWEFVTLVMYKIYLNHTKIYTISCYNNWFCIFFCTNILIFVKLQNRSCLEHSLE